MLSARSRRNPSRQRRGSLLREPEVPFPSDPQSPQRSRPQDCLISTRGEDPRMCLVALVDAFLQVMGITVLDARALLPRALADPREDVPAADSIFDGSRLPRRP